jgi:hypothetical protein
MSSGGPFRRRRAWRHLDSLAHAPEREPRPGAAAAHVRLITETGTSRPVRDAEPKAASGVAAEDAASFAATEPAGAVGPADQRVHAVPIDQPFASSSASSSTAAIRQG